MRALWNKEEKSCPMKEAWVLWRNKEPRNLAVTAQIQEKKQKKHTIPGLMLIWITFSYLGWFFSRIQVTIIDLFIVLLAPFSHFLFIFGRESRDPKMNSSQKISKHSPISKRKGSPAKFRHEDFSPERVSGHTASEHHYDNDDWSKKGREIKR